MPKFDTYLEISFFHPKSWSQDLNPLEELEMSPERLLASKGEAPSLSELWSGKNKFRVEWRIRAFAPCYIDV